MGKGKTFYYAIAAFIAFLALSLGAWYVLGNSPTKLAMPKQPVEKPASSVSDEEVSVSASDDDLDEFAADAERDLAEMENILADAEAVDASQDAEISDFNF